MKKQTVSSNGNVTAVGFGSTTITATDGNKTSTCNIVVMQNAISASVSNLKMVVGEKALISPVFTPATATETAMVYTYDKSSVISIDEKGVISALAAGTVTVTGQTEYGVSTIFLVKVRDPEFTNMDGDTNSDDLVDVKDLVRMKKHIAGNIILTSKAFVAADLSGNGNVESNDLILLKKILSQIAIASCNSLRIS